LPGAAADRASEIARNPLTAADVGEELTSLRTVLRDPERDRMDWLAGIVTEVVDGALGDIEDGSTEDELIAAASARFAGRGVRLPVVLVAADERITRYRHPLSVSAPILTRVMLVVVAERWGLHVAHTQFRELVPRQPDVEQRAQRLRQVLDAMRTASVPGNTLGHVLAAARTAYESAGMADEWTLHHQGGTIGYQARERIATPADSTPIEAGMAFAWNPSAVGFKLEETLYLDESGRQHVLTTTPL
jgi:Xaa-Pro aminopeptidase